MRYIYKITFLFVIAILVTGCSTIRKGFTPDKKSGEEFLVEKKSPLVMPPDYNELPVPGQKKTGSKETSDIKLILSESKNDNSKEKEIDETSDDSISSIEKLILKEIKNNQ